MVEALLAAGYRPTVYRNVAPPAFLELGGSQVLEAFDPFSFHLALSHRQARLGCPLPLCLCCCASICTSLQ